MPAAVVAHFVVAALLPALARRLGARVYLVAALVPAAVFGWLLTRTGPVGDGARPRSSVDWAPDLHLAASFRLSPLALLMALLVSGIGALVLAYARWYHAADENGSGRSASALLAFAGAMLGLVLADDVLTLYVFWELTTVFSFLLIGGNGLAALARRSAAQALLITTCGGLTMLAGLILLGEAAGTYRISGILADPPAATSQVVVAGVLILVGAASKSALLPFSSWLPAAMVAPTPVSAYLHAAAMVKAGVFLVATLTPAFATVPGWRAPAVVLGATTMIVAGLRALAMTDLKQLLAYGTVSQLGFLTALVGFGTRTAALAGAAMILAHALFKAALFMVVGIVDRRAGTRDLRALSGIGTRAPLLLAAAVAAAASMAGLPPFLGFVAKEAAFEAFWGGPATQLALLAVLVVGAALTAGYSIRFVWGAFADKPDASPTTLAPASPLFTAPAVLLAAAGLGLGIAAPAVDTFVAAYADVFGPDRLGHYHLALWHGPAAALLLSAIALAGGVAVFLGEKSVEEGRGVPQVGQRLPWFLDSQRGYEQVVRGVDRLAVAVAARTQVGSLPIYLGVIMLVLLAGPGLALLFGTSWTGTDIPVWDYAIQLPLAAIVLISAFTVIRTHSRLTAALLLGAVGYGIGALFIIDGAPDLALAQFLVESLSLIAFVFVLRRMPVRFTTAGRSAVLRWPRILIASAVGLLIAAFAVATAARPSGLGEASSQFIARSPAQTGATNVVNAIIIDFRALDTLGEISVLAVAALGVASMSLVLTSGRGGGRGPDGRVVPPEPPVEPGDLLATGTAADPAVIARAKAEAQGGGQPAAGDPEDELARRSVLLEVTTRAVFPVVLVFSVYLLLAGHTRTGGGFSGGLVAGLAFVLRYVAGRRRRVGAAVPLVPTTVIGIGLTVAATAGLVPVAFGGAVLQSYVFDWHLPLLGHVELATSLFFDIGVYLLVIGVVLELLRTLGTGVDKEAGVEPSPPPPPVPAGAGTPAREPSGRRDGLDGGNGNGSPGRAGAQEPDADPAGRGPR
ncbi:MAG: Na+/H+ antiporter subunit A [Frankia sp.]|nr:Na+/H+ antiporter subunit A [Frankia sp.]